MNVPKEPYCVPLGPSSSVELMPSRRLTDRIQELCAKAASAPPHEVDAVLDELKVALGEHTRRLRKMAAQKLIGDDNCEEKRSR